MEPAYEKLKFYQNISEIRRLVFRVTERFGPRYVKLVSQMRDAARSAKQNIREGYARDSAAEFARAIRISRGSLKELEGDIEDCCEDELLTPAEGKALKNLLGATLFQIDHYLDALHKLDQSGRWKLRFQR